MFLFNPLTAKNSQSRQFDICGPGPQKTTQEYRDPCSLM